MTENTRIKETARQTLKDLDKKEKAAERKLFLHLIVVLASTVIIFFGIKNHAMDTQIEFGVMFMCCLGYTIETWAGIVSCIKKINAVRDKRAEASFAAKHGIAIKGLTDTDEKKITHDCFGKWYIRNEKDIYTLSDVMIPDSSYGLMYDGLHYKTLICAERSLLSALMLYLWQTKEKKEQTFSGILKILYAESRTFGEKASGSAMDSLFKEQEGKGKDSPATREYALYKGCTSEIEHLAEESVLALTDRLSGFKGSSEEKAVKTKKTVRVRRNNPVKKRTVRDTKQHKSTSTKRNNHAAADIPAAVAKTKDDSRTTPQKADEDTALTNTALLAEALRENDEEENNLNADTDADEHAADADVAEEDGTSAIEEEKSEVTNISRGSEISIETVES